MFDWPQYLTFQSSPSLWFYGKKESVEWGGKFEEAKRRKNNCQSSKRKQKKKRFFTDPK